MIDQSYLIKELERVGISERETRVYVALLEHGELSAVELHKFTGLLRSKIYSIVSKMILRGLCEERIEGRNRFFSAIDPDKVMQSLEYQWEEDISKKKDTATSVFNLLKESYKTPVNKNLLNFIEVIRNKGQVHRAYLSLVEEAKDSICAFNRKPFAATTKKLQNEQLKAQKDALQRGVKINSIFISSYVLNMDHHFSSLSENDNLRVADELPIKMLIFDRKAVFMAMPSDVEAEQYDFSMVLIRDPGFVQICQKAFDDYWLNAKPVEEFYPEKT